MKDDLLKILAHSSKEIDNQKLMDYLAGKLSAEESHEVEKTMAENEFLNDAVEGLEKMGDSQKIGGIVHQMNRELQKKLGQNKARRGPRKLKEYPWIYLALILILFLLVICYIVLQKIRHGG
jgi:hypothetical protein